jgi:hypothetical protein
MNRFFFDVVSTQSRSYDYHGRSFSRTEDAANVAELIAMDLGCSETDDWIGSQVQVKNAAGDTLFSVPVVLAA